MEESVTNLPQLPNAVNKQASESGSEMIKLISDLQSLTAENSKLLKDKQILEKEKLAIERDLKKSNEIIQKSKDKNTIRQLMEEISSLRSQADELFEERAQNEALKTQIYSLAMKDDFKKLSSETLSSPIKNSSDLTAEILILKAQNEASERIIQEMRIERDKRDAQYRSLLLEFQDLKIQLENASSSNQSWWGKSSSSATAQQSQIPNASNLSLTSHAEIPKADNVSENNTIESKDLSKPSVNDKEGNAATARFWWSKGSSANSTAEHSSSASQGTTDNTKPNSTGTTAAGRSWWGKATTTNSTKSPVAESQFGQNVAESNSASVTAAAPNNQTPLIASDKQSVDNGADKKRYLNELQILTKELENLKSQLKESEDLLKKEKNEFQEKLQQFEAAVAFNKAELSIKETELDNLRKSCAKEITRLKETHLKETESFSRNHQDKISVLQESLKATNSPDSDVIQNIESKYNSIIGEREEQIRRNLVEYQSLKEELSKRHEEEIRLVKLQLEEKKNRQVEEKDKQYEAIKVNLQKSLQIIDQKELEIHGLKSKVNDTSLQDRIKILEAELLEVPKKMSADHDQRLKNDIKCLEEQHKKDKLELEERIAKNQKTFEENIIKERVSFDDRLKKEKASQEANLKKEFEDKTKKDKNEWEIQSKKEKKDMEDLFTKEKQKLTNEIEAKKKEISALEGNKSDLSKKLELAYSEIEKLKKDSAFSDNSKTETIKKLEKEIASTKDDLNKRISKIKALESEVSQLKSEKQKTVEIFEKKIKDNQSDFDSKLQDLDKFKEETPKMTIKIEQLNETISRLESSQTVQLGELEVLKTSFERSSKANQEKDDNIKKLKSKLEESVKSDTASKKLLAKIEKDNENYATLLKEMKDKSQFSDSRIVQLENELENLKKNSKEEELKEKLSLLENEKNDLTSKLENIENDVKLNERKNALLIKDLQKQLSKERKKNENMDDPGTDNDELKNSKNALSSESRKGPETKIGVPKVEKLTDDLIYLYQENENLKRKLKTFDDDIKCANERITKLQEESEIKSKTIRQYILRDNASKLSPEDRTNSKGGFNLSILSSSSAMSKMDPLLLSEINLKMQKLLEEMTTRIQTLESQINQC